VSPRLKEMEPALFKPEKIGLTIAP